MVEYMSTSTVLEHAAPAPAHDEEAAVSVPKQAGGSYKGFVAGVFSGLAKLSVGYAIPMYAHM